MVSGEMYYPHPYQQEATRRIIEDSHVGLFLDMGLGKTVATLTAIEELMHDRFEVRKCLVIAPLRVASLTWSDEVNRWSHLNLRVSKIIGTAQERLKALKADADVYTINRENVPWLVDTCANKWPFDMVVVDESSSFKNPNAKRFRALRQVLGEISRVVLLTGTPAPAGLPDLWSQIYLLDRGERLGRTISEFRERYLKPGMRNGYVVYNWLPQKGAEEAVYMQIDDICISMTADDWLDLPDRIDNKINIELPDKARAFYEQLKRDFVAAVKTTEDAPVEITATSAAALSMKLLQVANGAVYDADKNVRQLHDAKIDALSEIVDSAGEPIIVCYWFKHDKARLQKAFPDARELNTEQDLHDWNNGKIPVLLLHPASAGHGLNLQKGGRVIVWFGLTWSLELYQQANARLHRQGQNKAVIVHHLVAKNTMDERVLRALIKKRVSQDDLIAALKAEIGA